MKRELTCIICPVGCTITATLDCNTNAVKSISGAKCKRGEAYAHQEITDPQRTLQTSVRVIDGELPLVSVKTSSAVPKDSLSALMSFIAKLETEAPVACGDILVSHPLGYAVDIVATKTVHKG
jgi:CxxC motif-containing protein